MVSHQAIVNRLLWGHMACQLTPQDSMLHIASLSFDIAIWEIFGPWLAGARLILAQERGYLDIYLISLLNQQSITVAHFVPTLLELLVEQETFGTCRSLRWVLYGGEASSPNYPGVCWRAWIAACNSSMDRRRPQSMPPAGGARMSKMPTRCQSVVQLLTPGSTCWTHASSRYRWA